MTGASCARCGHDRADHCAGGCSVVEPVDDLHVDHHAIDPFEVRPEPCLCDGFVPA